MYEEFFGLSRRPFAATPDADCFVPLETHQGVLDALAVCCERGQGIGVLTGGTGLGKTLVGLRLAFELQPTFSTVFLGHSAFSTRRALLQAILFELNRSFDRLGEQELRLELVAVLKSLRAEVRGLVLIVDEAHRLSPALMDEVRLLTLWSNGGEPIVRPVLIADAELEERLADPQLTPFNQRIGCHVDLAPLTQVQSREYLRAQLEFAGGRADEIFTEDALAFLTKAADGVPRCLNRLADHALLLAYVTECRPISVELVRQALDDLKQLPLQWNDPVSGGTIYRGLSQHPPIEDSAVELWSQRTDAAESPSSNAATWLAADQHEAASAAIEIGGGLDSETSVAQNASPATAPSITCLKDDWQPAARSTETDEQLLQDVVELTQSLDAARESPSPARVFEAGASEFGPPTARSFAVEEFAGDREADVSTTKHDVDEISDVPEFVERAARPLSQSAGNVSERAWNSANPSADEFEEEAVIDRYVQIESGLRASAQSVPPRRPQRLSTAQRSVTTVKTTQLVPTISVSDGIPREVPAEIRRDCTSGIVESYSRTPRTTPPSPESKAADTFDRPRDSASEASKERVPVTKSSETVEPRDWHLPTELLRETLEVDGIESEIAADVLDLYLDVQQSLLDRQRSESNAMDHESPHEPTAPELQSSNNTDAARGVRPGDPPSPPETASWNGRAENSADPASEPARERPGDAIQRAYGRLFSELRHRRSRSTDV